MTGKIFLSYRREDTAGFALALFGRLEQLFPSESLFMDVEGGIGAGQDFVQVIEEQVRACDVMLVLIGPNWLAVKVGDAVTTSHFRVAQASNRAVDPPGVAHKAFGKSRQPISSTLTCAGPAPPADAIPIKARDGRWLVRRRRPPG